MLEPSARGLNIFFDVDNTIITWDVKLRPGVHEVFQQRMGQSWFTVPKNSHLRYCDSGNSSGLDIIMALLVPVMGGLIATWGFQARRGLWMGTMRGNPATIETATTRSTGLGTVATTAPLW